MPCILKTSKWPIAEHEQIYQHWIWPMFLKKYIRASLHSNHMCKNYIYCTGYIMIYVSLWNFNTSQYPFFHWTSWRTETLYINCISVEEGGTVNLRKFRVLHVYIHVQKNINDIREQTSLANIHRIWMKNSRLNGNCRWFVIN